MSRLWASPPISFLIPCLSFPFFSFLTSFQRCAFGYHAKVHTYIQYMHTLPYIVEQATVPTYLAGCSSRAERASWTPRLYIAALCEGRFPHTTAIGGGAVRQTEE
ncbi:hypothetical protein LZ31DRAFT_251504 [Colletotrichum somersetense]|nr:hypothetical protein LZ31DRAFT_251504 [Colletotrichum somersetense]